MIAGTRLLTISATSNYAGIGSSGWTPREIFRRQYEPQSTSEISFGSSATLSGGADPSNWFTAVKMFWRVFGQLSGVTSAFHRPLAGCESNSRNRTGLPGTAGL